MASGYPVERPSSFATMMYEYAQWLCATSRKSTTISAGLVVVAVPPPFVTVRLTVNVPGLG